MLIGNDVVDLLEATRFKSIDRPGWKEKIFTPSEMDRLSQPGFEEQECWAYWAAKEAAFKAISRAEQRSMQFIPTAFCVRPLFGQSATYQVDYKHHSIDIHVQRTPEWILALVVSAAVFYSRIFNTTYNYDILLNAVSDHYGCSSATLTLEKDVNGVPWLCSENFTDRQAITIAHHGRFWGFGVGI